MKINRSLFAVSLLLAMGSAIAADPVKTDKPASPQPMDHSKMDRSGKKPVVQVLLRES